MVHGSEPEPDPVVVARRARTWRRLEWGLLGLFVLFVSAGVLLLWGLRTGRVAKALEGRLVEELRAACGVELAFDALRIEPTEAALHLAGLDVATADGRPLLSVSRAYADLRILPLLRGRIEIPEVVLVQPRATIRIRDGALVDLPTCLTTEGGESGGRPPPLGLEEARIDDGRFELRVDDDLELDLRGVKLAIWPGPSGGTDLVFDVGGGRLAFGATATELGGLRLVGHAEGTLLALRAARLERLQASLGPLELDARGEVDLLGPVYRLETGIEADLRRLGDLLPGAPAMDGSVALSGVLSGSGLAPEARVTARVVGGRVDKFRLGDETRVEARADRDGVDLEEVVVELGPGRARLAGRIDFNEQLSLRATARPERLSFARLMQALGEGGVWVDFLASGVSRVKGTLNPVYIEGPLDFEVEGVDVWNGPWNDPAITRAPTGRMLDVVPVEVEGRWTFTPDTIEVANAEIRTERSRGWASAFVRHQGAKRVEVDVDFERLGLLDLGGIAGIGFRGSGPVSGRLAGPFEDLSAVASLSLEGIAIADIPLGGALAELRWDGKDRLSVTGIEGTLGTTRWHGGVGVAFGGVTPVRLKGEITRGRLGDLLLPLGVDPVDAAQLEGEVQGRFELDGPVSAWSGPVRLEARGVRAYGEPLGNLDARGRMARGRVVLSQLVLEEGDARTRAEGWLEPGSRAFELSASVQGLPITRVEAISRGLPELSGMLDGEVELAGRLDAPEGTIAIGARELAAGRVSLGRGRAEVALSGGRAVLEARLPQAGTSLDAEATLRGGLPYEARLRLERAPLPSAAGALLDLDLRGIASLDARLGGRLAALGQTEGSVRINLLRGSVAGTRVEVRAPVDIAVEDGALLLDEVALTGGEVRLTASGPVGADRLALALDGRLDLRMLSSWVPPVERAAGSFGFVGSVRRGPGGVDVVGTGEIADGALEWRGVPNRFSGIRGQLTFSQSSILVEGLSARWAGGRIQANGSMLLEDLVPSGVTFAARVDAVRPRLSLEWMDLSARLDGGLEITGDWPDLRVAGELEVREGRAVPRTDLSQLVGARRLAAAYDPSAEILRLDVALPVVDRFRVRNDDVDVSLTGDLRLTGTNERLGLLGTLTLERGGRLSVVGREYVTEGGIIELRDRYRIEPKYDLQISTSACDARIRLGLVGDLDEVETRYSSNPEMDREDIVSCLVRGVKRRDLDQDLASFAGSALLKLSGVDRQVKRVIPIDQIDVTTEFSSRARAYEPRVLVAKDLFFLDRPVRLEYSTSLLRGEDQRAALRVRLTPRLSLELGWTSSEDVPIGDWGLDLERRWEW